MAIIQSGASVDTLTVDPVSKAARQTLYGPDGEARQFISNRGRGVMTIQVRQTATTAANSAVWSLRNITAGKTIYVTKIWLQMWFDGTGAATFMQYALGKDTTVTLTNGTAVTPLIKRTSIGVGVDNEGKVLDTSLTLTGVTQGATFFRCGWPRLTPTATQGGGCSGQFTIDFGDQPLELAQNECLTVRLAATAVVGDNLVGGVEFHGG